MSSRQRKMTPKKLSKNNYTVPYYLDPLIAIHQGIVAWFDKFDDAPSMAELSRTTGYNSRQVWTYMHHLRELGAINFRDYVHDNGLEVIIRGDIEPIARKVYGQEGYLVMIQAKQTDKTPVRRFRKCRGRSMGNFVQLMTTYQGVEYFVDGWDGDEYLRDDPWWMKDYTIGRPFGPSSSRRKFKLNEQGEIEDDPGQGQGSGEESIERPRDRGQKET